MTGSKEQFQQIRQNYGFDIDMSGHLYVEKERQNLEVTETHFGRFYKAKLNGEKINRKQLFDLIGIKHLKGFRLGYYVDIFKKQNSHLFNIEVWEQNVE